MTVRRKILVVDDEKDLCFLVKDNLERTGAYSVVIVTDEMTTEEVCRREMPDLILLDVVMPRRKGSQIVQALKDDEMTKEIPIVIMSGLGEMVYLKEKNQWRWVPNSKVVQNRGEVIDEIDPKRAAEIYGVSSYIAKPFSSETLIEVIEGVFTKAASPEDPGKKTP